MRVGRRCRGSRLGRCCTAGTARKYVCFTVRNRRHCADFQRAIRLGDTFIRHGHRSRRPLRHCSLHRHEAALKRPCASKSNHCGTSVRWPLSRCPHACTPAHLGDRLQQLCERRRLVPSLALQHDCQEARRGSPPAQLAQLRMRMQPGSLMASTMAMAWGKASILGCMCCACMHGQELQH